MVAIYNVTKQGESMNTMYEITIGTELDKNGNKIENKPSLVSALKHIADTFGGYSLLEHTGGYTHDNGSLAIESSLTIKILAKNNDLNDIKTVVKMLKNKFNQESVLLISYTVNASFI